MQIRYIYHDGFLVELEKTVLLFDYWKGNLPPIDPGKQLCVFASHVHPDHFSFEIFRLREKYPDVQYFLGNDIRRKFNERSFENHGVPEEAYRRIAFMKAGTTGTGVVVPENNGTTGTGVVVPKTAGATGTGVVVRALQSTDSGVAFLVSCERKEIFHAGDLNDWSFEKNDEETNAMERSDYRRIIDGIRGAHFDAAFLPLDPKQGKFTGAGFDYFMRSTDTEEAWPMHRWGNEAVLPEFLRNPLSEPYRGRIRNPEEYR
ncbi:MAG: MBL fold metallo-hydrolase [Lachnospiraceae bacterium]|nr:MBL fold metallo-hydrolase [Lachnospiraceae bacterium]